MENDKSKIFQDVIDRYKNQKRILGNGLLSMRVKGPASGWSDRAILEWSDKTHGTDFMSRVYWENYN